MVNPHFYAQRAARPLFQDDTARLHRARIVTDNLAQEGPEKLPWPSKRPDVNPFEHCWHRLGCNVRKRSKVNTLGDLARALVEETNIWRHSFFENWPRASSNMLESYTNMLEGIFTIGGIPKWRRTGQHQ